MIDASVILAILLDEPDATELIAAVAERIEPFTTPAALTEVALRLANLYDEPAETIERDIEAFLTKMRVTVRNLEAASWPLAVSAISRYGKGRHPAALNFGDSLAYAAARHARTPLMYKGDDFALTDVNDGY